ncbi:MAG: 2-oxoacid:ferredoxin oxidoreductase subunit beta [Chloroherpetonaceae bacterium]|nr:2-oxoacid:ferredoxin oxidoreductase subunit beta [Chloroherpetonaceae bacterium]
MAELIEGTEPIALSPIPLYTSKDLVSDQDIRWCPGCGDYSILKQVQAVIPEFGIPRENLVFISGIGCSSRFPYYMETFGVHSIHGRAAAIASGLKMSRPELSVWIVSGDGDSLSIGANHFVQLLRRNLNVNLLLFNNEIYGLTKGQFSPTSHAGIVTKSTPYGAIDHPLNPASLALGADGSFVARTLDRDVKHLRETLKRAQEHIGTSMVEIYQNCVIFNDGAFEPFTDKGQKATNDIFLEQGKPLVFGAKGEFGIRLDGIKPTVVNLNDSGFSKNDLWIHDETDQSKAAILSRFFDMPGDEGFLPRPFGVLFAKPRALYEEDMQNQINNAVSTKGAGSLDKLLSGRETWVIE